MAMGEIEHMYNMQNILSFADCCNVQQEVRLPELPTA